jgi:DNA-binding NarL/FixJ family response regulator
MSQPVGGPHVIGILIAEDHLIARVGVKTIINMQPDMSVVGEAANGAQAVELYRKHHPDVTLMDMRMPGMSGAAERPHHRVEYLWRRRRHPPRAASRCARVSHQRRPAR